MAATLTSYTEALKDAFPPPGTRIKQYIVDRRREAEWERETCPRFMPAEHDDNTGAECRNSMAKVPWTYLEHDCCHFCCDLHERYRGGTDEVKSWLAEKTKRPPIETDRTKRSNEIEPEMEPIAMHPLLAMLKKKETP